MKMFHSKPQDEAIARVCHEACRAYCQALGDNSQLLWEEAPEWQRRSAVAGVRNALSNPGVTPEQSHHLWMETKLAEGWKYGPAKDAEKKVHPAMLPYDKLPREQKAKDYLFLAIVRIMRGV